MAHGTQTSSRDSPRLWIDLPRLRDALGTRRANFPIVAIKAAIRLIPPPIPQKNERN